MWDFSQLDQDGFMVIENLLMSDELSQFEDTIALLVQTHTQKKDIRPTHADPFEDIFRVGGEYTDRLYALMERLGILQRITARVSLHLEESGFFEWAQIGVPLIWPDIRADIRADHARSLPIHQDFASTHCENSWRLWIPLRQCNTHLGSMKAYPGTHKAGVVSHNLSDPLRPQIDESMYTGVEGLVFDLPAGHAVLMNPLIFHASVPNASDVTKFTLMIQVQDLSSMIDPTDQISPYHRFTEITEARARARREAKAQ